ncbi:MAG: DUF2062 domain-containing protein [Deltaproteobacteria bacterium]|nr:DUF2062 domain-containing protein [Deltaproteobacteria bacterium]
MKWAQTDKGVGISRVPDRAERDSFDLKLSRQLKYYYLRFIRLRGQPHELALGMALGVFTGMMPIMPFQIALAVMLAMLLKSSKITAALGTWISNPLNWYFLYYYSYKIGAWLLSLPEQNAVFAAIMAAVRAGEDPMVIVGKILGAGGLILAAFLLGGLAMGLCSAGPAYLVFLWIFRAVANWRRKRRERRRWALKKS